MTSLFLEENEEAGSDEGKGEAGGAVSSQTAGCEPRAGSGEILTKGKMPRARRQALMSAVDNKQPAIPAEKR